jgi:trk system potassium uptake protein TrkH
VGTDVINSVISFFVIFFVSLGVSAMALALTGLDLLTAFLWRGGGSGQYWAGLGRGDWPIGQLQHIKR